MKNQHEIRKLHTKRENRLNSKEEKEASFFWISKEKEHFLKLEKQQDSIFRRHVCRLPARKTKKEEKQHVLC